MQRVGANDRVSRRRNVAALLVGVEVDQAIDYLPLRVHKVSKGCAFGASAPDRHIPVRAQL